MANRDSSDLRKRREREDEDEAAHELRRLQARGAVPPNTPGAGTAGGPPVTKIQDLMDRIPPLIEQVNQLYQMYFAGVEKRPPIERRQFLDQSMTQLAAFPKPTSAIQFKATQLLQTYQVHKDRWERMLRAREK